MIPSPEQEEIVGSTLPRFSVRAAAGSGKTRVLVDRFVRHVAELGFHPDEIVTITFTRKAASEMKKRIIERLRDLGRHDDAQSAETGRIQTIHGFCESILRENSIEALIDPEFEVLEGAEEQILVDQAITNALLEAKEESALAADYIHRYSGKHAHRSPIASHSRLRTNVQTVLEKMRGSGVPHERWAASYKDQDTAVAFWMRQVMADLPMEVRDGRFEPWGPELHRTLKELGLKPADWLKSQRLETDLDSARDTCGLVWLALTAWSSLEQEMGRQQKLDFNLLESKAVHLLESSPVARERIRRECKVVLVDEAQDLNPLQYRIIDRLDAPGEMMVGDPQQSIYGFRFADRELFNARCKAGDSYALTRNYRSGDGILAFVDNVFSQTWGSEHVPMTPHQEGEEFDPFGSIIQLSCEGVELWPTEKADAIERVAMLTRDLIGDGTDPKDIAILTRGNVAVNSMAAMLRKLGVPARSVGASERFYTRLEVRDLANALEAVCDPYEDFQLLALLRSPFVGLSLDAVTYLGSFSPVIEVLEQRGPWSEADQTAIDAFRVWFGEARSIVDRVPAWEVLSFLMRETAFLVEVAKSPTAEQAIANVRKLFTMASAEPELNSREFASRIREIRFLKHRESEASLTDEEESAVTVMTVHKAKGLEFDVVILADTQKPISGRKNAIAIEATRGLIVTGMRKRNTAFFTWLSNLHQVREREEEFRVLYVAMTRAKKRLCIVTHEEGGSGDVASLIAQRAGMPKKLLPGIAIRRVGGVSR